MYFVATTGAKVWEENPHLAVMESFAALKKKYGDEKSGNLVLSIHLVFDPASALRAGGYDDIEELKIRTSKTYFHDRRVKWGTLQPAIDSYLEAMVSDSERHLAKHKEHISKAQSVLDEWEPTPKDLINYNKAVKSTSELEVEYLELEQRILAERAAATVGRGGKSKSLTEKLGTEQ